MNDRFTERLVARKGAEQGKARGQALDAYAAFGPLVADVLEMESWRGRALSEREARLHARAFSLAFFASYDAAREGRKLATAH